MKSTKKPMPVERSNLYVREVLMCIHELVHGTAKNPEENWRVLADVVNCSETFIKHKGGVWKNCHGRTIELADDEGLIKGGIAALAEAGRRNIDDKEPMVLLEKEAEAMRDLVDCWQEIICTLPWSEVEKCKRITHQKLMIIVRGHRKPDDVVVEV